MKSGYFRIAYKLILFGGIAGLIFIVLTTAVTMAGNNPIVGQAQSGEEVFVPAGQFGMGCTPDFSPVSCDTDAAPTRMIYVDAFYIDKTEVTNARYAECVAAGVCPPPLHLSSSTRPDYYTNPAYANYPVIHINWVRAYTYCAWAGKRLPTEAEWEKAARGTDMRWFAWGNDFTCERGNFRVGDNPCVGDTTPVGNYPAGASPYGALDMTGNVLEWTNDIYVRDYYKRSPYNNPQGGGPDDGERHDTRGGSWANEMGGSTTWIRLDDGVEQTIKIGFRCAHSATTPPTLTPSPTLAPTSTPAPTPTPFAAGQITSGGTLWLSYPKHLTLVNLPPSLSPGTMTQPTTVTLRYEKPGHWGRLAALDHSFSFNTDPQTSWGKPITVVLAYLDHGPVIQDSIRLYRLETTGWVTEGITLTSITPGAIFAQIDRTGQYGLMGRTRQCYLPIVLRTP